MTCQEVGGFAAEEATWEERQNRESGRFGPALFVFEDEPTGEAAPSLRKTTERKSYAYSYSYASSLSGNSEQAQEQE